MAETVRIEPSTHALLMKVAKDEHITLTEALTRAVAAYRKQLFFDRLEQGYAELRKDERAWREEVREREAWDVANADGLTSE